MTSSGAHGVTSRRRLCEFPTPVFSFCCMCSFSFHENLFFYLSGRKEHSNTRRRSLQVVGSVRRAGTGKRPTLGAKGTSCFLDTRVCWWQGPAVTCRGERGWEQPEARATRTELGGHGEKERSKRLNEVPPFPCKPPLGRSHL